MENAVYFNTKRNGYGPYQCGHTMTVGALIDLLGELFISKMITVIPTEA